MSEEQENFENAAMQESLDNDAEYIVWLKDQDLSEIEFSHNEDLF